MSGTDRPDSLYFGRARIAAALLLIGAVVVLFFADVLSPTFAFDSIQLGLMLGTSMLLLGVEAGRKLLR